MRPSFAMFGWAALLLIGPGCADRAPAPTPPDASPPAGSAPAAPAAADIAPPAALPTNPPPATASAEVPTEPAPAEPPAVDVEVKNIGMHIGGGPNDKETKHPIKVSVEPHFEAFQRCFGKAEDTTKGGDFGVDLRIEREGGKAKVTAPRTAIDGDAFKACVLSVFEAIDFQKPKGGATVVSYSLRFTPR